MKTVTAHKATRRTQPDNANCPLLRAKLEKLNLQLKNLRRLAS